MAFAAKQTKYNYLVNNAQADVIANKKIISKLFVRYLSEDKRRNEGKKNSIDFLVQIIPIQKTKFNQSHKTLNISHFTPIRTGRICKLGRGFLTYITDNINFSPPNSSNTFSIELQIIKIHLSTSQQLYIANMYPPR